MSDQEALTHDGRGGIWSRFYLTAPVGEPRAINAAPWHDALAQGGLVGNCRPCGGYLRPEQPYRVDLVTWYPARCIKPACRRETAAAGPRPKPKPKPRERPMQ